MMSALFAGLASRNVRRRTQSTDPGTETMTRMNLQAQDCAKRLDANSDRL
jgi:hypothetical protein